MDLGKGLYIDLHGHSHTKQRLEIGYLLYGSELRQPNSKLNSQEYIDYSSIKNLVNNNINNLDHADLLKGELSFGFIISNQKYPRSRPKMTRFHYPGMIILAADIIQKDMAPLNPVLSMVYK